MSSTFTPTDVVDHSKEKEWAANLGMMDWDNTRIVFTKRSLLEFLKYTGTTVDTNFSNIQKLPKYATFGKLAANESEAQAPGPREAVEAKAETNTSTKTKDEEQNLMASVGTEALEPSRPVRTAPEGPSRDIFGNAVDEGVLADAPPKNPTSEPAPDPAPEAPKAARTSPFNTSTTDFWGTDISEPAKPAFRPSRRVREQPGGKDSISSIF